MRENNVFNPLEIEDRLSKKAGHAVLHNTRGLSDYASALGFGDAKTLGNTIRGKKILDATAGCALFAREVNADAKLRTSGTVVISVDPYLQTPKDHKRRNLLAAFTDEALPFPNSSFDYIFDRNGFLLWYDPSSPAFRNAFKEMSRVLRSHGEIRTGMSGFVWNPDQYVEVFASLRLKAQPIPFESTPSNIIGGFILTK
jgi:SAM-dependent methyltransferase